MLSREELVEKLREIWARDSRNEIYFEHEIAEGELSVGTSKIGGDPDVPQGFEWPQRKNPDGSLRPLSFLMQINLAETAPFDKEKLLPTPGVLSFFYDYEDQAWGSGPDDFDGWKVFYFEDAASLTRVPSPEYLDDADANIFQESVKIASRPSIPDPYDEIVAEANNLLDEYADASEDGEDMVDLYEEIAEELGYNYNAEHDDDETKLFGFPFLIQNPMEEDVANLAAAIFDDTPKEPSEWILLLQISLSQEVDDSMRMFGDAGSVYYWISKDDLKNKRFDRVMLQMQCY